MSSHDREKRTAFIFPLMAFGGFSFLTLSPSQADVALTAQQSVQTASMPSSAQTIRLFYKGSNVRLEVSGGPVVLYDGKGGIIRTLDPAHKTYYTTLVTQIQDADDPVPPGMATQVKENTTLNLRRTDQAEAIAGMNAHRYTLSGTITFSRSSFESRYQGRGGHHHGGGGFPGGGSFPGGFPFAASNTVNQYGGNDGGQSGYGGPRNEPISLPQWNLSGEIWLSDTLNAPDKADTLPTVQLAAASAGPFLKPLSDALGKQKGLLLLARITVTKTPPSGGQNVDQFGGVVDNGTSTGDTSPTETATSLTIQSVSTAPLDDKLFQTPLDYTLIPAPLNPYVPGDPVSSASP